jgi:hypothetical protein
LRDLERAARTAAKQQLQIQSKEREVEATITSGPARQLLASSKLLTSDTKPSFSELQTFDCEYRDTQAAILGRLKKATQQEIPVLGELVGQFGNDI